MDDFAFSVVKELSTPSRMVSSVAFMEKLIYGAVKITDSLVNVINCVRMYHIEQDGNVHSVSRVYQFFKLSARAVS